MSSRGRPKRQKTGDSPLDMNNFLNWNASRLREELSKSGLKTATSFSLTVLRKLYTDNVLAGKSEAGITSQTAPHFSGDIDATPEGRETPHYAQRGGASALPLSTSARLPAASCAPELRAGITAAEGRAPPTDPRDLTQFKDTAVAPVLDMLSNTFAAFQSALTTMTEYTVKKDTPSFGLDLYYKQQQGDRAAREPSHTVTSASGSQQTSGCHAPWQPGNSNHGYGVAPDDAPRMDLVTTSMRQRIIQGKDVNFAALLIPSFDFAKDDEKKLTNSLNIIQFLRAFGKYKRIMCGVYPNRRDELDGYEAIIQNIHQLHGDRFYEYHKLFSMKSATALESHKIKLDWSKKDSELYCMISANATAKTCANCGEFNHDTVFCPAHPRSRDTGRDTGRDTDAGFKDKTGRQARDPGLIVCRHFNGKGGCFKEVCHYKHTCTTCSRRDHGASSCPTQPSQVASGPVASGRQHKPRN